MLQFTCECRQLMLQFDRCLEALTTTSSVTEPRTSHACRGPRQLGSAVRRLAT